MVRIGMLGSGFVAEFYMVGLREVPGQQVVVNFSQTEERAQAFAKKWGVPNWTTSLEQAIQDKEVDLLLIALPNFLHKDAAVMAAKAGKNMVCTKPLARNPAEAKEMLEAATAAGVMQGYAETEVFSPAVMKAREVIEQGGIGDVFSVRSREAHAGPHAEHFWDPDLAGGGALMDMGCHCIEAARYFIGKEIEPVEVLAWGDTLVHDCRGEDNAILLLRFQGKQIAQAEVSWTARGGLDLRNEVYGSEGAIFTDVTRGTPITVFSLQGTGYVVEKSDSDTGWVFPCVDEARIYGYHEEMRHFVECVAKGQTPRETFQDGYLVNVIIDAAYKSMTSRKWEPVRL